MKKLLLLVLATWMCLAHGQQVVIVPVRSYGQGLNEASAVKDAVVQAVGQVTGERVTASTSVETKSRESSTGVSEHSAKVDSKIDSLIKGVVKSSSTVSVDRDPATGIYKAVVDVRVASFKASAQLDRVKLAVVKGSQALPASLGQNAPAFTQSLINGASDKLVTASKFAVLDQGQQEATQKEFAQITSGGAGVENYVRLQSRAVADFLVILDVADFTLSPSPLGKTRLRASARAMVYDYTSGQVRQVVTSSVSRTLRDDSTATAANVLGADLAEKIIENVFPAKVLSIENQSVYINAGAGQFEVGDVVKFHKQGTALKDPYTKEFLGYAETDLGEGVVESVTPKISVVRAEGLTDRAGHAKNIVIVARRKTSAPGAAQISVESAASLLPSTGNTSHKKGGKNDDNDW